MSRNRKRTGIHEPSKLTRSIGKKQREDERFSRLVQNIAGYAIENAMPPRDIIDASIAAIQQLEFFCYRMEQHAEGENE